MHIHIQSGENFGSLNCGQTKKAQSSNFTNQQLEDFHTNVSDEIAQQEGANEAEVGRMIMIKSEIESFIEDLSMKYSPSEVKTAIVEVNNNGII